MHKICESEKEIIRCWDNEIGRVLMRRLTQLQAASSLEEISRIPPVRLHELKGKRRGQFAIELNSNYRLIIVPAHDPVPKKDDGGIDWKRVTKICVIEVVDYHDE
jgi:proteic killer suppression protein